MGHWCWVCGRILANERFSGKGHARHICKECSRLPKEKIQKERDIRFLYQLLFNQRRISDKNIQMLKAMCEKYSGKLRERADAVLQLAQIRPNKKKRFGYIYHNHRELYDRLVSLRLINDWITPSIEAEELTEAYYDSLELPDENYEDELEDENWSEEDLSEYDDNDDLPF